MMSNLRACIKVSDVKMMHNMVYVDGYFMFIYLLGEKKKLIAVLVFYKHP